MAPRPHDGRGGRSMIESSGTDCLLHLKVVPGSSRDAIVGMLGDRLKVKVAAAAEAGRANAAVCELLGCELGLKARDVEIVSGHTSPEKTIRVKGLDAARVKAILKID